MTITTKKQALEVLEDTRKNCILKDCYIRPQIETIRTYINAQEQRVEEVTADEFYIAMRNCRKNYFGHSIAEMVDISLLSLVYPHGLRIIPDNAEGE